MRAGDRLSVTSTIEAIKSMAGNDILDIRGEVHDEAGEHVVTAWTKLVARARRGVTVMTAKISYADVEVGTELPAADLPRDRAPRSCSTRAPPGDFNPIHWNEKFAKEVGLPDVIAHGMFTMAEAIRVVTDWAGDPGAVVEYGVRFTKPVVVPERRQGRR